MFYHAVPFVTVDFVPEMLRFAGFFLETLRAVPCYSDL